MKSRKKKKETGPRKPIRVYYWSDAPARYRLMSKHDGAENYVIVIPKGYDPLRLKAEILDALTQKQNLQREKLKNGDTVYITATRPVS